MNSRKKYKIALIEPSFLITEGLRNVFQSTSQFEVISCSPDLPHFFEHPFFQQPDLILINPLVIAYHKQHSLKSIFSRFPDPIFIAILSHLTDEETLKQYHGYISLHDDKAQICNTLYQTIDHREHNTENTGNYELSKREIEILVAVVKGMQNKEIAEKYHLSIHTVISHRKNISRKTGIKSVAGLTVYTLLHNLIDQKEIQ